MMALAEIAVLAHEALDAAREGLENPEAEYDPATLALVSIAASLYLLSARVEAPQW